ncbi:Hsp20/alpha crystallin family protein [Christiangramia sediminis]|uniref:Hsp20/alpha crystallin family protein n=1 Tax=Christiangramia sediminis TaxID=2881336 RepID=A0A9X1LIM2_9FLAO|nr:Hsp20/alpha crystallin family protein [Christiangramia sediminis]MCB7481029.1 Hsp20/alpha crystallin family protein [Christiangramia sediminis]
MSLVKFRKNRRPWFDGEISNWLNTNDFFTDDFFGRGGDLPAMNVKENEANFEIELAVPGFSKKDIEVSLENDILHISAEKSLEDEENKEDYTRREFSYNSFDRRLQIPKNVNRDQEVKASYKNGVLKLQLSKMEPSKAIPKKLIDIEEV